jgi:hypothetical protein
MTKDTIVSKLKQQLEVAGLDTLHLSDKEAHCYPEVIEKNAGVFESICQQKPDKAPILLTLGLLTKLHIEAMAQLENQIDSVANMTEVFANTIGESAGQRFDVAAVIELSLVTKLWLMVQGHLAMDFSLANEHAQQTSLLLERALKTHSEQLRTELLASYYHGKDKRKDGTPSIEWSKKIWRWFGTTQP